MQVKLIQVIIILGLIFIVNRLVIPWMVGGVARYHKKYNKENLDKGPVRFLIKHEKNLIMIFTGFYWIAGVIVVLGILLRD